MNLSLLANPGGATLAGTLTAQAVNGVATFSGLSLNRAATGYTFQATSGTLPPATAGPVTITPAPATQLLVTTPPPATVSAGGGFNLAVSALDDFGDLDTTYNGPVTLTLTANPGNSIPISTTVVAVAGVATFTNLILNNPGTGYQLTATAPTENGAGQLASATTSLNVVVTTAVKLVVSTPASPVTAGAGFGVTVMAEDSKGNLDTTFNGTVFLSILNTANPGGSTLGTPSATASGGVATFTGLTLNKAGAGYQIVAQSGTLSFGLTSPFTVTAAPATQLVLVTQPPLSTPDGTPFEVIAFAEDANGNRDTTFNGQVTVSLQSNPVGSAAVLGGTLTQTASAGQAVFSDLTLNKAGSGYALQLATTGVTPALTPTTTIPFTIAPQQATQLVITTQPSGNVTAGAAFTVVISAEDANGNIDPNFNSGVTLNLQPGGASLGTVPAVNGLATFTGLTLTKVGSGFTLAASSGSLPGVTSTPSFGVVPAPASQLFVTTQPTPNPVQSGSPFTLVVTADDRFGNLATTFAGSVSLTSSSPLGGTTIATTANGLMGGVATFTNLTLGNASGVSTIQVTSAGLVGAITGAITVTPAPAATLVVTTQPPTSVTAGVPFGLVVAAEDSSGNLDPTYGTQPGGESVTISGTNLSGTLTVPFVKGIATFTNLVLTKVAIGDTFSFLSSTNLTGPNAGPVSVSAAAATQLQLAVTSPPSLTSIAPGSGLNIIVTAEDPFFNTDPNYNGQVTLSVGTNPSGSTLGGTVTVQAGQGVAKFTGVTLNQPDIGATATATLSGTGVGSINVTSGGIGYSSTSPPVVTISAPPSGGTQATANAVVNPSGVLTGITVTSAGSGYTTAPTVTLPGFNYTITAAASPTAASPSLTGATSGTFTVANTVATQFTVSTPPASVVVNTGFGLTVTARDANGQPVPSFTGTVTLTLLPNAGGAALIGPLTAQAVGGVATFSSLSLTAPGTGYQIQASGAGLAVTTSAITVTPVPATQVVVVTEPPSTVAAGSGFSISAQLESSNGNLASSSNATVTLKLQTGPGGATFTTVSQAASGGVVTFTGLTLTKAGSGYTFQVASTGLASATTTSTKVTPLVATQLQVTAQPPANVTVLSGFGLVVAAEDPFGNVDPTFNGNVTLTLPANNPGGPTAVLGGTTTVGTLNGVTGTAINGIASFANNLTLNNPYGGAAATATLSNTGISAITVTAGGGGYSSTSPPTVIIGAPPSGGTQASATAVVTNGVVTGFTNIVPGSGYTSPPTVSFSPAGYTIVASSGGLTPATTAPFNAVTQTATQLVLLTPPPSIVTADSGFSLVLVAENTAGAIDPTFTGSVALTIASGPGAFTSTSTTTASMVKGVVTFANLALTKGSATPYVIRATTTIQSTAVTLLLSPISVIGFQASQLVITTQPAASVAAGAPFSVTVSAEDSSGNVDTTFSGPVTISLLNNPGGAFSTLGGTTTVNASGGVATFSGLTLTQVGTGYTFQITSGTLTPANTTTAVTDHPVGAANQINVLTPPPASVNAGNGFGVVARDHGCLWQRGDHDPRRGHHPDPPDALQRHFQRDLRRHPDRDVFVGRGDVLEPDGELGRQRVHLFGDRHRARPPCRPWPATRPACSPSSAERRRSSRSRRPPRRPFPPAASSTSA